MEAKDYRRIARENLANNWALSIGVAVLASMLGGLLVGGSFIPDINFTQEVTQFSTDLFGGDLRISFEPESALNLLHFILGGVIQLGYVQYLLKQYNKASLEVKDLFSQFERFGQGFAQAFLRGLYTFLWGLLFVIPGIVKSYSYAMTPFIMADHPEMTASEAINASKAMMDGHKADLFWLDLTFIGWDLLAALTLNLGHIALNPYKNAARTAFYRDISRPNPEYFQQSNPSGPEF